MDRMGLCGAILTTGLFLAVPGHVESVIIAELGSGNPADAR
jgi:hypothetical protein